MMQSVPENSAIRSKRDPRKKSSRRKPTRDIASASASADHIYSDLGLHQDSGKVRNTAKKAAAKIPNSHNAGLHPASSPELVCTRRRMESVWDGADKGGRYG